MANKKKYTSPKISEVKPSAGTVTKI
jgi:hypothetical protein